MASAYVTGLKMLARRELSEAQIRTRLARRQFEPDDIDAAVTRLQAERALDDRRTALACARTEAHVKRHGRLRALRQLETLGIARDVARAAVGEVFGDLDERAMIARALQKKLRGRPRIASPAEHARLYQFLMRQGFSPAGIVAALRTLGGRADSIE